MADWDCEKCRTEAGYCQYCDEGSEFEPITNADRIRSFSDEELAEFLCGVFDEDECDGKYICGVTIPNYDEDRIAEWLKSEAKE